MDQLDRNTFHLHPKQNEQPPPLHVETPLIRSAILSDRLGCNVMLKMENTQPSMSFKLRGIGNRCQLLVQNGCRHLVSSSGGNAGLAVSYSGRKLRTPVTVFVPQTTADHVIKKLQMDGAQVCVKGRVWDEANQAAMEFVEEHTEEKAALVHPFDHPEIWTGHASMCDELHTQLDGTPPSCVVLSVGGGGLLVGVVEGLHRVGWKDVPVIAMETVGADCFSQAVAAGEQVTLPAITSIAKSLGSLTVVKEAMDWRLTHTIIPQTVRDRAAVQACLSFADDHKTLVEPACGAALAACYGDTLSDLRNAGQLRGDTVVVVVCGGYAVRLQDLQEWKEKFEL